MFEHRHQPLVPRSIFLGRLLRAFAAACLLTLLSLAIGAVGYHVFEGLRWIDSIYNASMILTGMGPATELKNDAAKVFATCYALFSGLVFLTSGALVLTPIIHRLLHHFHLEDEARKDEA